MAIELNHTIIPSADKVIASSFYARIFGFECLGKVDKFYAVKVNETLNLLFDEYSEFNVHHYAFKVDDETFEIIFNRLQDEQIIYGSDAYDLENMQLNHWHGGRGVYFRDPNGHILELLTRSEEDQLHLAN